MGTVNRSRNPAIVLTASGEVHTHEEAQVFVHDLNQFATVQLLEETPAVLSPGKLCKYHGYSYEWVSGQEPRLAKEGKVLSARQTISYLLSFATAETSSYTAFSFWFTLLFCLENVQRSPPLLENCLLQPHFFKNYHLKNALLSAVTKHCFRKNFTYTSCVFPQNKSHYSFYFLTTSLFGFSLTCCFSHTWSVLPELLSTRL